MEWPEQNRKSGEPRRPDLARIPAIKRQEIGCQSTAGLAPDTSDSITVRWGLMAVACRMGRHIPGTQADFPGITSVPDTGFRPSWNDRFGSLDEAGALTGSEVSHSWLTSPSLSSAHCDWPGTRMAAAERRRFTLGACGARPGLQSATAFAQCGKIGRRRQRNLDHAVSGGNSSRHRLP